MIPFNCFNNIKNCKSINCAEQPTFLLMTSNITISITHTCNTKKQSLKKAVAETSQTKILVLYRVSSITIYLSICPSIYLFIYLSIYIIYIYTYIYYCIKRIHRVSYQIYKAKLKNELTPSRNKTLFRVLIRNFEMF